MYDNLLMSNTKNNRYYAFSHSGVGFVILDSNDYTVGDDGQTEWLNQTLHDFSLKNSLNFVFMHHPLLHEQSYEYHKEQWSPLFQKYNVTGIFAGHLHNYQRSFPITRRTPLGFDNSELYNYTNINHPIYIVSGGAGSKLYNVDDLDFIAKSKKSYNFLLVEIRRDDLKVSTSIEAWELPEDFGDLYMMDNITITKSI